MFGPQVNLNYIWMTLQNEKDERDLGKEENLLYLEVTRMLAVEARFKTAQYVKAIEEIEDVRHSQDQGGTSQ